MSTKKYLSIREAAKILELSLPQTRALLTPDQTIKNPGGGYPRVFFKYSQVKALKEQRQKDKEQRWKQDIKKELGDVQRPKGEYLTLSEAALLSGLRKGIIRKYCRAKIVYGFKNKNHHFYAKNEVLSLNRSASIRSRNNGGRSYKDICAECGKKVQLYKGSKICTECQGFQNKDDPHGTMIKPKKQTRKCPIPGCNAELWEGQYMCTECRKKQPQDMDFDAEYAYGGLVE